MKRRFRVRDSQRFQEVRRDGRAYTNELLVLCALPNHLPYSRCGFAVNSRIGNAVARNRIKRCLREAMRLRLPEILAGWDVILIARRPIRSADFHQMSAACARLLRRAHLLIEPSTHLGESIQTGSASDESSPVSAAPRAVVDPAAAQGSAVHAEGDSC